MIRRRLRLASHVYNSWTARGTDPAALAAHLMDGSVEALEKFVTADHNSMHDGAQQAADSIENSFSAFSSQNTDIPRRHAEQLSYDEFVLEYMAPNLPVMIEVRPASLPVCTSLSCHTPRILDCLLSAAVAPSVGSLLYEDVNHCIGWTKGVWAWKSLDHGCMQGATEGWQACRNWVTTDGGANLEFLAEHFGQARIWATASVRFEPGCLVWHPWSFVIQMTFFAQL